MNFFESQDRVRKNTTKLVILFVLAVVSLIIMTNLLVMLLSGYITSQPTQNGETYALQIDWKMFAAISAGVSIVVLAGSLYKIMTLSAGGKVVAESLGGKLVPQSTDDLNQRKLLNVVQEMAIASGTPAPPVYLLADENGINAFAAGFSPRDAVIGITQGTIDHLSREQLQGVIAHEFSHIFNGDMRLNIRLMGILNGILVIGLIGYFILRSAAFSGSRRSNNKGAGGMLALAIGLMVLGFAGTFFGGLIKAAVSRQREYLADATAVQFTRNPDGIAGALKRIGGLESGSKVENPGAPEISHAFFAQGITGFMQSLSATHPPLASRIRRIDPGWDGKYESFDKPDLPQDQKQAGKAESITREELAGKVTTMAVGAAIADITNAIDRIGSPGEETIKHARTLISEMPSAIKQAASEPYGARAVVYSMVLDKGQMVRDQQLQYLKHNADPDVFVLTGKIALKMELLHAEHRLPLIDIAIPTLKQLSVNQYKLFRNNLVALIELDNKINLMEWSLQKILFNHLDGEFLKLTHPRARYSNLGQLQKEIALVLSIMAYAGHEDKNNAGVAFNAAANSLELNGLQLVEKDNVSFSVLDRALERLARLKPLIKPQLLKACAISVIQDTRVSPVEVELLRAFSDVLDCPMPPMKL